METQQAFGSPGGKTYLAPKIAGMIPPHKTYVEPFVGGGAVYFQHEPSEREVIGDKDTEIAFAYKFLRDMTPEQFKKLQDKDWMRSEAAFDRLKAMKPENDVERFYRFYYLKKGSYRRAGENVDVGNIGVPIVTDKLPRVHERLKRVKVYSGDAVKLINQYDSPSTFHYLDPPYPGHANVGGNAGEFANEDLQRLVDKLKRSKGKFMLSLGTEHAKLLPRNWHIHRVKVRRNMRLGGRDWHSPLGYQYEIIATNYKPRGKAKGRASRTRARAGIITMRRR